MLISSRVLSYVSAVLLLGGVLIGGCAGGSIYSVEEGQLFQRYLPTTRHVSHHPDSVQALTIGEGQRQIQYSMEGDLEALIEKWSCTLRYARRGAMQPRSYATFWSLELALASLQPELGILSLSKSKAHDLIEKRRKEYFDTIHIDVYWFRGNGLIAGPEARVRLEVADSTYRPIRRDYGPIRQTYVEGGVTTTYRRNTFYFPRIVNGTDLLKDAAGMRLLVLPVRQTTRYYFVWSWEEGLSARSLEDQE